MRPRKACKLKGRYGAGRYPGRCRFRGIKLKAVSEDCECSAAWLSEIPGSAPRWYAMNRRSGPGLREVVVISDPTVTPPKTIIVVPCQEKFLHQESVGTRAFLRAHGQGALFRGCQELEDQLVADGLVVHGLRESLGRRRDLAQDLWMDHEKDDGQGAGAPKVADSKNENNSRRAFLLSEHIGVRYEERRRDHESRVAEFLKTLTHAQRQAVWHVWMFNKKRLSQAEIARKLDIGLDSLRERLELAAKKLARAFPEFRRKVGHRFND